LLSQNRRIVPYCPELPIWPKIKNPCWKLGGGTPCYIYFVVTGGQAKIHVTGHSLGAWVAIELAMKFKDRISGGHVFNAGSNPLRKFAGELWQALWASISDDILYGEFYHHHIFGDLVSSDYKKLPRNQTINYTEPSWMFYEKHGIDNFAAEYDNNWEFPLIWFSRSTRFSDICPTYFMIKNLEKNLVLTVVGDDERRYRFA
jgi:pimeloyl-ACP methyl ester carboxylesterase